MITIAALYRFTRFDDPPRLRAPLARLCGDLEVKGIVLLAPEGINGTIAGSRDAIDAVLAHIRALPGCAGLEWKESIADAQPFHRMKVRLKREIVTMGQPGVDPGLARGQYVEPAHWNALISAPDVALIDTRNGYEVRVGTFQGAIDPGTGSFGEFPAWWAANGARFAGKRIAMFCTGGIRCEKSTNYLISQGVKDVFHLKGGILKYLEKVPEAESLWRGECFVFDGRVAVGHGLAPGTHAICHACGMPVSRAEMEDPAYEAGVSCARCIDTMGEADRARFRERQRQMDLGLARGRAHLGRTDGE